MGAAKLHEWVASPATVTCACLGPRTATLVATGGDDKRCGVWRLGDGGDAACLATLSGASSAGAQPEPAPTAAAAEDPAGPSPSEGSEGGGSGSSGRSRVRRRGDGR